MKVTELRAELKAHGLDTKGKKAELEARLQTALEAEAADEATGTTGGAAKGTREMIADQARRVAELEAEQTEHLQQLAEQAEHLDERVEQLAVEDWCNAAPAKDPPPQMKEKKAAKKSVFARAGKFVNLSRDGIVATKRCGYSVEMAKNSGRSGRNCVAVLACLALPRSAHRVEENPASAEVSAIHRCAMTVNELRGGLRTRGLDTKGKKAALEARLQTALEAEAADGDVVSLEIVLVPYEEEWEEEEEDAGPPVYFGFCKADVEHEKSDAWCMCAEDGSLHGNGKRGDNAAGGFAMGDRFGCRLDLGAGTLSFFKNGAPHGATHTGVVGPVRGFVEICGFNGDSVSICAYPSFEEDLAVPVPEAPEQEAGGGAAAAPGGCAVAAAVAPAVVAGAATGGDGVGGGGSSSSSDDDDDD